WDQDRSAASRSVVESFSQGEHSPYFALAGYVTDPAAIEPMLARGEVRFVLVIPHDFARDVAAGRPAKVQALVDGADSNTASIALGYASGQLTAHASAVAASAEERWHGRPALAGPATEPSAAGSAPVPAALDLRTRIFYNPDLNSTRFIVPGIIALL